MSELNKAEFLARRKDKLAIFDIAQFENINSTFPETEAIIESGTSANADDYDIKVIIGLKRGWQKVLDNDFKTIDINFVKSINKTIGQDLVIDAGEFRTQPIGVEKVKDKISPIDIVEWSKHIDEINNIEDPKERAIEFLIYSITTQPFNDGNKRTAFLVANEVLIRNNIGVIFPNRTPQETLDFSYALNNYYNNKTEANIAVLRRAIEEEIELVK